jgi:hypothetical protein
VGVGTKQRTNLLRGVCLSTSTIGWRTLQQYKKGLNWLDDLDGDGKVELIVWDSFPLNNDGSLAEYGLMAWVYRLSSKDLLIIDGVLSRRMAREIAEAYRSEPETAVLHYGKLRKTAAEALEQFAEGRCTIGK